MLFVSVLRNALLILVPLSITLTTCLYLYPVFKLCSFPTPNQTPTSSYLSNFRQRVPFFPQEPSTVLAPFRLLAFGDPQLEGDTSLDLDAASFPNFAKFWRDALGLEGRKNRLRKRIKLSLHDLVDFYFEDIPNTLEYYRKRLDLIGNDYYLAHIYRTLHWWTNPTHVSVLGDLVGSQWISDAEFESRGHRYWSRVFKHGKRVEDELAFQPGEVEFAQAQMLGEDAEWNRRIINIAGNHDIGYAGDLTPERFARFERAFGKANYELRFQLPPKNISNHSDSEEQWTADEEVLSPPEIRIVVLNNMNLDSPVLSQDLQTQTYTFLNNIITTSQPVTQRGHFTLILTHIPLYKPDGVCTDGPLFHYHTNPSQGTGIKEQNHLSQDASKGFLEGLLGMSADTSVDGRGMGRKGLIINGHDHEGCDVWHFINQSIPDGDFSSNFSDIDSPVIIEEENKDNETFLLDADLHIDNEFVALSYSDSDMDISTDSSNSETPTDSDPESKSSLQANPEMISESKQPEPSPPKPTWQVTPFPPPTPLPQPGTREITLRSQMGDYHGTSGLLSLSFDPSTYNWNVDFSTCSLGRAWIWWAVHIFDLATFGVWVLWGLVRVWEVCFGRRRRLCGIGESGDEGVRKRGDGDVKKKNLRCD